MQFLITNNSLQFTKSFTHFANRIEYTSPSNRVVHLIAANYTSIFISKLFHCGLYANQL